MESFKKDDIVVCILNNRANLTIGQEYRALYDGDWSNWITVKNDSGETVSYTTSRFISKSVFRDIKLNQILDEK